MLTPEALAKRIGEAAPRSKTLELARMLAIDCGNTQTAGLFDGDNLREQFRVATDRAHTGDELAVPLRSSTWALDDRACSSVLQLVREQAFADCWTGADCPRPGVPTGMLIRYDDPRESAPTGSRTRSPHASATARRRRSSTSTNFDVVSAAGEFAGGVLAPGIEISMDAPSARGAFAEGAVRRARPWDQPDDDRGAAVRPRLASPVQWTRSSSASATLGAPDAPVVATGGLRPDRPHTRTITAVDPELTLRPAPRLGANCRTGSGQPPP